MFRNANNTAISGGTFTVVNEEVHEGLNGRQILSQSPYVVHGAIHDSGQRYPPSECHPGTREDVLKIALDWVDKPLDDSESQVFWLSGPAGVGKTAIAQSLCQRLKELGQLGGDFFLSRSVAGHSDLHTLFPTLAYQLAGAYPDFGFYLDNVIKSDESVLTKNMGIQLDQLIINPLKRAHSISSIPLVVVVDGLDEAGAERDQTLLLWILESFISHRLPLKIILTSRPEPWIKSAFGGSNPLAGSTRCHFLHRTSQTDIDIRKVLQFGFESIQKKHDLMTSRSNRWPSSEVIDNLVDRASGQFIYASTLLRYVEDQNGNPVERLQWIVEMPSEGIMDFPFLALDNLYKHVLSTSSNLNRTLTVLGAIIASFQTIYNTPFAKTRTSYESSIPDLGLSQRPVSPPQLNPNSISPRASIDDQIDINDVSFPIGRIERMLNLRVADGSLALRTIHSLVDISSSMEVGVKFYHKSFQDFLLDHNRSGEYFLDMTQVYSKLMAGCLRLFRDFEQYDLQSKPRTIYEDLQDIEKRWMVWWLLSAASDEAWLLAEVKAIDKTAFNLNYTKKIAQKIIFSFSKSYRAPGICHLTKLIRNSGNIAELISSEANGRKTFGLSYERFRTVETFFIPRLIRARSGL
ncbi:hypothetical protein BJ912DRAFT_1054668 [Pholiota molesta]|nr:hypothetical protein BJ912DRAFT_1054668 [Pholiota molesta]